MSFELAVQGVVYNTLFADAPLNALIQGVFDDVPQHQTFPYVSIGESTHNQDDTVGTLGDVASIIVHSWSRARGKKETKQIQGAIYDALHRKSATYTGYDIIGIDWEGSQSFTDADGLTRHGVTTFKILLQKV
jgi:hypothetical protein